MMITQTLKDLANEVKEEGQYGNVLDGYRASNEERN